MNYCNKFCEANRTGSVRAGSIEAASLRVIELVALVVSRFLVRLRLWRVELLELL